MLEKKMKPIVLYNQAWLPLTANTLVLRSINITLMFNESTADAYAGNAVLCIIKDIQSDLHGADYLSNT